MAKGQRLMMSSSRCLKVRALTMHLALWQRKG